MMIVDTSEPEMTPQENPPSYYLATRTDDNLPPSTVQMAEGSCAKHPLPDPAPPRAGPSMPPASVYHYVNPATHEHVASLLPPDHPEMICLQAGGHIAQTKFGLLGILVAVFWFPIGIGLCLLDRRVKCRRCGVIMQESICG